MVLFSVNEDILCVLIGNIEQRLLRTWRAVTLIKTQTNWSPKDAERLNIVLRNECQTHWETQLSSGIENEGLDNWTTYNSYRGCYILVIHLEDERS